MALGIVPNGIKIEFNAMQNGIPIVQRVFVTKPSAPSSVDLDDAVIKALAYFNTKKSALHESYVMQTVIATDVSVANGTQTIFPLTTANTGTAGGIAAAANAAMCISLRTNFTGRSFRGRFYEGGLVSAGFATAQNFLTGYASGLASFFDDFITALSTVNMTLVVVSNYANKVLRATALATEIISIIVDTKVDSQRRRTAN